MKRETPLLCFFCLAWLGVAALFSAVCCLNPLLKHGFSCSRAELRRQDFANPQVAEMVKRGYVVSLANYLGNPDLYLVEMLTPRKPSGPRKPLPPMTSKTWFWFLALCASVGIVGYAVSASVRRVKSEMTQIE